MQWLTDFTNWFTSPAARPVIFAAVVLAIAIVVSGLLAAWVARGAVRSLIAGTERERRAAVIATLVDAATEASVWNSLTPQEQVLCNRAVGQAETHLRLLPIRGAGTAADWAAHQLADIKRTSATFGYQLEPEIAEFRERLVEWQSKPSRARRLFQGDLERWRYENTDEERSQIAHQDAWVATQHHEQHSQKHEHEHEHEHEHDNDNENDHREHRRPDRAQEPDHEQDPTTIAGPVLVGAEVERERVSANQGYPPIEPEPAG